MHRSRSRPAVGRTTIAIRAPGAVRRPSRWTLTPTVAVAINNTDVNVANNTGTVTFTFSEAPTAFNLSDTSAVGGSLSNLQLVTATLYTAIFTGAANSDTSAASVSVTAGSWQEVNGNPGSGGSTARFTVDTVPNPALAAGTTADMILRSDDPTFEIYDIGSNAILAAYPMGQVGLEWQVAGLGGFYGTDTSDMILRNSNNGAFEVYDISNNTITSAASMGRSDWSGRSPASAISAAIPAKPTC
jgi:hypothetical protein